MKGWKTVSRAGARRLRLLSSPDVLPPVRHLRTPITLTERTHNCAAQHRPPPVTHAPWLSPLHRHLPPPARLEWKIENRLSGTEFAQLCERLTSGWIGLLFLLAHISPPRSPPSLPPFFPLSVVLHAASSAQLPRQSLPLSAGTRIRDHLCQDINRLSGTPSSVSFFLFLSLSLSLSLSPSLSPLLPPALVLSPEFSPSLAITIAQEPRGLWLLPRKQLAETPHSPISTTSLLT